MLDSNKFWNGIEQVYTIPCLSFFRRVNIYSLLSTWINILFIETRTVNLAVYLFSKQSNRQYVHSLCETISTL